jgi:hypothetical protein
MQRLRPVVHLPAAPEVPALEHLPWAARNAMGARNDCCGSSIGGQIEDTNEDLHRAV